MLFCKLEAEKKEHVHYMTDSHVQSEITNFNMRSSDRYLYIAKQSVLGINCGIYNSQQSVKPNNEILAMPRRLELYSLRRKKK